MVIPAARPECLGKLLEAENNDEKYLQKLIKHL
jgi:hypothetical protein